VRINSETKAAANLEPEKILDTISNKRTRRLNKRCTNHQIRRVDDKSISLKSLEDQLGIRKNFLSSILKKYKALLQRLAQKEPYNVFYEKVQPEWHQNMLTMKSIINNILTFKCDGKRSKRRQPYITLTDITRLTHTMNEFMQLSNGRAWAGFEYPMNGKILEKKNIEVDSRFRNSIRTDEMFKGD